MCTTDTSEKTSGTVIIHLDNLIVGQCHPLFGVQLHHEYNNAVLAETLVTVCNCYCGAGCVLVYCTLMVQDVVAQLGATFLSALEENLQYLPLFVRGTPAVCHLPDFQLSDCRKVDFFF